jgi:hypothetical protein
VLKGYEQAKLQMFNDSGDPEDTAMLGKTLPKMVH